VKPTCILNKRLNRTSINDRFFFILEDLII
jgi:hypothetical protein